MFTKINGYVPEKMKRETSHFWKLEYPYKREEENYLSFIRVFLVWMFFQLSLLLD